MSWTTERVELLKKLWSDGLSASQIAGELGGVTRNAVIGKVHRLGLSGRAKTPSPASKPRRNRPSSPSSPASSAGRQSTPQPQSRGATALKMAPGARPRDRTASRTDRRAGAYFRAGDDPDADGTDLQMAPSVIRAERTSISAGRHSDPGVPYCAHHCKIAYQPVSDRRRDRRVANTANSAARAS